LCFANTTPIANRLAESYAGTRVVAATVRNRIGAFQVRGRANPISLVQEIEMTADEALQLREMLVFALERLSEPAPRQIEWLTDRSLKLADELALDLDDVMPTVPQLIQLGVISPSAEPPLRAVDDSLEHLNADESKWDFDALACDPEWAEVRHRAAEALIALTIAA